MAITKFGQHVRLEVRNLNNEDVGWQTEALRVDFDIDDVAGFITGRASVFGLADDVIQYLTGKEPKIMRLWTSFNDGVERQLGTDFFVFNVLTVRQVPDRVTHIYGFPKIHFDYGQKQIQVRVVNPSIDSVVRSAFLAAGFNRMPIYIDFPDGLVSTKLTRPIYQDSGSLLSILQKLGIQHRFTVSFGHELKFIYNRQKLTDLSQGVIPPILVTDREIKAPVELGVTTLRMSLLLNPDISMGSSVDISQITARAATDGDDTLKAVEGFLRNSVSGQTIYTVYKVKHKGSNWISGWDTTLEGLSPQDRNAPLYGNITL